MFHLRRALGVCLTLLVLSACAFAQTAPAAGDVVGRARTLAIDGKRDEALALLRTHLTANADDGDARVLYGTILSWNGQYDTSRRQLEMVLQKQPGHADATAALINVELWSNHPQRAEQLAAKAVHDNPENTSYQLSHARALQAMSKSREALDEVRRVLDREPSNETALQMRRGLWNTLPYWQLGLNFTFDSFDDNRDPWQQGDISLRRQTRAGSFTARAYRARRGGVEDQQFEAELNPRFRPGSYATISVAVAPDAAFFPDYRFGVDFWQSLTHGFEGAAGFRRLHFAEDVDIYTVTLGDYFGNWYVGGRSYIVPNATTGRSVSVHGWARRFIRDADTYVGVRYGRGASREELRDRNDLTLLRSDTFAAEANLPVGDRLIASLRGSVSRNERVTATPLRQVSFTAGLFYRF